MSTKNWSSEFDGILTSLSRTLDVVQINEAPPSLESDPQMEEGEMGVSRNPNYDSVLIIEEYQSDLDGEVYDDDESEVCHVVEKSKALDVKKNSSAKTNQGDCNFAKAKPLDREANVISATEVNRSTPEKVAKKKFSGGHVNNTWQKLCMFKESFEKRYKESKLRDKTEPRPNAIIDLADTACTIGKTGSVANPQLTKHTFGNDFEMWYDVEMRLASQTLQRTMNETTGLGTFDGRSQAHSSRGQRCSNISSPQLSPHFPVPITLKYLTLQRLGSEPYLTAPMNGQSTNSHCLSLEERMDRMHREQLRMAYRALLQSCQ